jgi:hypothetical protein
LAGTLGQRGETTLTCCPFTSPPEEGEDYGVVDPSQELADKLEVFQNTVTDGRPLTVLFISFY